MSMKIEVHTRLSDPALGSVYVHRMLSPRKAWRAVSRAARLGAAETWFFTAAGRAVSSGPGYAGPAYGAQP